MTLKRRFWGSTIALVFGVIALLSIATAPGSGTWLGGFVMVVGALIYRSAKRAKLGLASASMLRSGVETAGVLAIVASIGLQSQLLDRMYSDPVPNLIIPIWALAAYAVARFVPATGSA